MRKLAIYLILTLVYTNADVLQAVRDTPTNGKVVKKAEEPKAKCAEGKGTGNQQFGHEETCFDVPASYSQQLWQADGWIGNDKHGYWPIDGDGKIDPSKWKSSIMGVMA